MVSIVDTREERLEILNQMRAEGLDKVFLYSFEECSDDKWLELLENSWVLSIRDNHGKYRGIAWFNNINGNTAQSHFCLFEDNKAIAKELGEEIIKWLEEKLGVTALTGITPIIYRHARNIVEAWGFKEVARLPEACYFAKNKKHVSGILYVRHTHEK